jgi:hypothetical protein
MQSPASCIAFAALCCAFVSGCNGSNQVSPDIVQAAAEQATKIATLEFELRDAKKALSETAEKLKDTNTRLASSEKAEALSRESALTAKESLRKAVEQNDVIQRQLDITTSKLRLAESQLGEIEAKREQVASRLAVVGRWQNGQSHEVEFRDDGTGVYGYWPSQTGTPADAISYSFRYAATDQPGVYKLSGTRKSREPVTGLFRVDADGKAAELEGWDTEMKPRDYSRAKIALQEIEKRADQLRQEINKLLREPMKLIVTDPETARQQFKDAQELVRTDDSLKVAERDRLIQALEFWIVESIRASSKTSPSQKR